ncbi:MAG: hypothetical protein OSA98_08190 [Rubripirellula sp.]|nr:hypothetical protein [Rubripirellula sp.]
MNLAILKMLQFNLSPMLDRRQFLFAATSVLGVSTLGDVSALEPDLLLRAGKQNLFRVRMDVEMKGNVNIPSNPLASRKPVLKLPIESKALFDYEERFHLANASDLQRPDARSNIRAAERYYHRAKADSTLNRNSHSVQLRDSVRDTIVRHDLLSDEIYGVEDFFERDELELLRVPISSMAIDQLLPAERVRVGSRYKPSAHSLTSVLNLTAIMASDIEAEVVSLSDDDVKIQLRGTVDGSVDGVPTAIRTVGKLTFDRKSACCTWLAIALQETREIGRAEPGFDVAATIKMLRQPLRSTIALPTAARKINLLDPVPASRLYVSLTSEKLGFSVLMDRRWRMMRDQPNAAMMRMVANDRSIGQCDIRPRSQLVDDPQGSLIAFESDVKTILGEQLVELVESDEQVTAAGIRVLRVVANGSAEGVPVRWILMHLSDDSGKRIVATFTMEASNIDAFGGSDMQLAGAIHFADPATSRGSEKTSADAASVHAAEDSSNQVADSISNANTVR